MKAINGWTKELMIARVREKVPKEGCRNDSACLYRGPGGTCCAVGAFMPDDHPMVREVMPIDELKRTEDWMPLPLEGMVRMQSVHDDSAMDELLSRDATEEVAAWIEENVE